MQNSTCTAVCWIQFVVYIPTLTLGLVFNLSALWLLIFRIKKFTESTVFLANLIFNDCLLLFSLPFKMYAYRNSWKLGDGLCSFLESLLYVNMYGSILIIACISVDRYIALRHPFFAKTIRSPRKATVACIAIWIIIFGASGPVYKLHGKNTTDCFKTFSNETWNKVHIVVGMETVFIASALVLIFCSIHVIKILITMQKRNTGDQQLLNNKSIKIILTNLISFLVCFIPYHIAVPMYFMKKKQNMNSDPLIDSLRNFIHISICLTSINCLFDGICYYFIIKEITISARQTATETTELTDVFRKTSKRTCTNLRTQLSKDDNQQLSLT